MHIDFEVAGTPAEFDWNNMTGKAVLKSRGEETVLQDPRDPSTHFRASTTKTWQQDLGGHSVQIVKVRPLFFASFRQNRFTVSVDGAVVNESSGH